jgi:hypothetical protein
VPVGELLGEQPALELASVERVTVAGALEQLGGADADAIRDAWCEPGFSTTSRYRGLPG